MIRTSTGKQFEKDFKASIPPGVWYYRFRDSPATFYGGQAQEGVRFSLDNICDCEIYQHPYLHLIELKTVGTPSASLTGLFGKWDEKQGEYKKQKHLYEMRDAARHPGITASVIINFREVRHTYAVTPQAVLDFIEARGRKSIPEYWCVQHGICVEAKALRVNWRYNVSGLLRDLERNEA